MAVEPFTLSVDDAVLDDLRDRLRRTRFSTPLGDGEWQGGVGEGRLRRYVERWLDGYDWRAVEARLNGVEQGRIEVNGHHVHYARIRSVDRAASAVPLLLLHGWPSAFTEYLPLAERLASTTGGGFDVIIPSLPGFVFSEHGQPPLTRRAMAGDLHALMVELGITRYGAFGGDIGGGVAAWLAHDNPDAVIGLQLLHPPFPADLENLTVDEQAFLEAEEEYDAADGGYSEIMSTRPDTIAAALADSPAGLLAWIVDKWHDWVDGDLDAVIDIDELLTIATLYWVSGSIGSSFRQYYDWPSNPPRPVVPVPLAVLLSNEEGMRGFPRSLAERAATDLRGFERARTGGHFIGLEQPDTTAAAILAFFGSIDDLAE